MRLEDLLAVLRDEFAQAADDIDAALGAWMGDEATNAPAHGEALFGTFTKLAEVSRMVELEGHAQVIEQLRDAAQLIALSDEQAMAAGVGWLAMWREPVAACFEQPGNEQAAQAVIEHLALGPVPPSDESAAELRALLCTPPELPVDPDYQATAFAAPDDDDVSIAMPDDVDAGLYETFLAEAPDQLARLGDTIRELARGPVDVSRVVEAQRVAHTFKGSGNIIGIRGVGQLAHRMEDMLDFAIVEGGTLPQPMARDLERAAATLDQMIYALRGEEEAPTDALALLGTLVDWARAIDDGTWPECVMARLDEAPVVAAALAPPSPPKRPPPPTPRHKCACRPRALTSWCARPARAWSSKAV
jgi:HPt (histidine-containing phosphotransfer) domain-containing protein